MGGWCTWQPGILLKFFTLYFPALSDLSLEQCRAEKPHVTGKLYNREPPQKAAGVELPLWGMDPFSSKDHFITIGGYVHVSCY